MMKRGSVLLEPWSTKEKLCLSSAVLRSGDQNWMTVSRILQVFCEKNRPPEWYSQKQCALQYELLLNSFSTSKRKKRSEKAVETADTPTEHIVKKLLQDRLEELNGLLEEDRKEYKRLKNEKEDIENGLLDDRLDEFEKEIEEEKEKDISEGYVLRQHEGQSRLGGSSVESEVSCENSNEHPESKVPTSPLLTSLLQSPSHYRGSASMHSLLAPTPPTCRVNDSPTLSRLLESPAKQVEPVSLVPTRVKKEPEEESTLKIKHDQAAALSPPVSVVAEELQKQEVAVENIKTESLGEKESHEGDNMQEIVEEPPAAMQIEEIEVEMSSEADVGKPVPVSKSKPETEELYAEKEEQEQSSLNTLQDSDTMEDQHSITELDSQMVNMIVAGGGVISVSHDTSSEHLDVNTSDILHKDDSEAAENSQDTRTSGVVEIEDEVNLEGTVLEVGEEAVNLDGAVIIEDDAETTVHEVEVLVSGIDSTSVTSKCIEEDDSTQDEEIKDLADTPETEPQEESQEEDEVVTYKSSSNEENEVEDKEEDRSQKDTAAELVSRSTVESPSAIEDDFESGKRPTKKRLISGSACSDSKPSSPASHMLEDSKEYRSWKKSIMLVFNRMATHKYASIFLRPITNEQAPAYDSVIHRPVDLSTIKKRIETGELRTTVEFQRDLLLMFQNAIMYNNCRTLVYEMASTMQNECMQHIELMVEAMGEGVPWRKDVVTIDKLNTRGRGEPPKRKRTSLEESKTTIASKRRKDMTS